MNINTRDLSFLNFNGQEMQWLKFNNLLIYETWKELVKSGILPLTLNKCKNANLLDYKIYGNTKKSILPDEYQQVEYIENHALQCIDTGLIPTNNTSVELTYQSLDIASSQYILGSRQFDTYGTIDYAINGSTARTDWDTRFSSNTIFSNINRTTDRYKSVVSLTEGNGTWTLTNLDTKTVNTFDITNANVNATKNLYLFAYNISSIHRNLRVYECKISEGSELIRYFIPCYRKSDNVIGMYDLANDIFYINATSNQSSFTVGPNIPSQEAPAKVESVGEKTNNLINPNEMVYGTINQTTGELETSSILQMRSNYKIPCKYGDTFIQSNIKNYNMRYFFYSEDDTFISTLAGTPNVNVTVPNNASYMLFITGSQMSSQFLIENQYQLIKNGTIGTYEPYGYKVPVKASGKNEFNYDILSSGHYTINNEKVTVTAGNTVGWADMKTLTLKPNTQYSLFVDNSTDIDIRTPANVRLYRGVTTNNKFTTDDTGLACFKFFTTNGAYPHYIGYIYLCETNQEPITTNIYLDEPLRKMGDYADYIDFENKQVIRKVGVKTFDGTEEWILHTTTNNGYGVFRNEGLLNPLIGAPISSTFMSHFQLTDVGSTSKWEVGLYRFTYSSNSLIAGSRVYISANQTTVDEFKNWLSANNPSILYPVANPEPKTIELPNIPIFKGTNILETVSKISPSYIEVKYLGKGKNELLEEQTNLILNSILNADTSTELDITNTEINQILNEIIGG